MAIATYITLTFDPVTLNMYQCLLGLILSNFDEFRCNTSIHTGDMKVETRTHRRTDGRA